MSARGAGGRTGSGIGDASAPYQLLQCTGPDLGDSLLKANPNAATETLPHLLAAMRSIPNSNSSCPLRATHRASPAKASARLSNRASCTCFRSPCEKIIASLWRRNSSRDLKTELCTRVWELCCRSELWT